MRLEIAVQLQSGCYDRGGLFSAYWSDPSKDLKERDHLEDINKDDRKWDLKEKWIKSAQDRYR
jgi:hypothetical protein